MKHDAQHDRVLSYEGRPLPRPEEEVVDQGLGFDIGTLLNRRRMLAVLGLGATTAGLAACGAAGSSTSSGASRSATASASDSASPSAPAVAAPATEIPDETAGPYPGDGSSGPDVLEQSGIAHGTSAPASGRPPGPPRGCP